jgi:hypothetical protein
MELTLNLVEFKFGLDASLVLGELIKTERHIPSNFMDLIPENETIQDF